MKRQLKKKDNRKGMFDSFGSGKITKEGPREELRGEETSEPVKDYKDSYIEWPPKPKENENKKNVFDNLGKL